MAAEINTTPPNEANDEPSHPPIPPADRGPAAWKFLLGSFLIEAILWGFNLGFGVFQEHYSRLPQFRDSPNIPVIGTVATSLVFLGTPLAAPFVKKYHAWRQVMVIAGCVMCVLGLVWASYANSVGMLIASQGALYGAGVLTVYAPLVGMINEWFDERRGFAYGVVFAGGGVSGAGLPFLAEWLLHTYGYRTTLRGIAVAEAVLLAPVLPLIKGRLPSNREEKATVDWDFLQNPLFWVLAISNVFQGFAIYIPSIYLPTFATLVGLSPQIGALILAALNVSSTLGQVVFGHLSDRYENIYVLVFVTMSVSAVSSLTLWGLGQSLAPLLISGIVFGFFGGAYVVFWPKFALLSKDPLFLYGLMTFGKGIGNVVAGPITSRLLFPAVSSGYGLGKYKYVIIYTGVLLAASSVGVVGWPLKRALKLNGRSD